MRESTAEFEALQNLLDRSFQASGEHLRTAFQQAKRPSAQRLIQAMRGIFETHLAVLSGSGAPLVAPVDAMWFHGKIWFGLPGASLRARLVQRDDRVSTSFVGTGIALIAHGTAVAAHESALVEFEEVTREIYVGMYGPGWLEWHKAQAAAASPAEFTGYIEPRVAFATVP